MSLPYHIGNGWFGGMAAAAGDGHGRLIRHIYNGMWYPIVVAAMSRSSA